MRQLKKVVILLMFINLLSGCSKTDTEEKYIESYAYEESNSIYNLENDNLLFELDPSTTYFTVTDKSTGAKWYSNPEDLDNDTIAYGEYKNQLKSTLLIEFSNAVGTKKTYSNYEYSIARGLYEIEQNGDKIEVKYSIGDIVKAFVIPYALPESKMLEYLEMMETSGQRQVKEYYRIYDINKIKDSEKSDLLEKYPELEQECMYVLRDNTKDHLKGMLEKLFEEVGFTYEDYVHNIEQYSPQGGSRKNVYNISVVYSLEGNDLVVNLPYENMEWYDDYPLARVKVLPFMGAGGIDDEGFILIPEASGAVIEFNNGKIKQGSYYADVYGWDYAIKRTSMIDESRATFPVFGISKNDVSMLCLLEDYATSATIEADISGKNNSYNYANASYRILQGDTAEVSGKSDRGIYLYEKNEFTGAIKQRYTFLDTADYKGMAEEYRNYLMNQYEGLVKKEDESVPVNISIVGGIDKVESRFGMPMSLDTPLTTFKETNSIMEDLIHRGFKNMNLVYIGWMNGGIKHTVLNKIKPMSALGSKKELKDLVSYAESNGIPVYLEGNVMFAYDDGLFDGYSINSDSAKHTTREIVELYNFSQVTFRKKTWATEFYLVKPQKMIEYSKNLLEASKSYKASGVALRDVGYKLSADYNPKNHIVRDEVKNQQQELLSDIKNSGSGSVTYGGYDYVIPYSDYILDMDLYGGNYLIIDYMVPFYQLAIHGLVNYFGKSVNLAADYTDMILKSAEYGAGLSFTFIMESAITLQESYYYTYLYGSEYELWKDLSTEIYQRYNNELSHCFNQYMTDHKKIADGVYVTSYEDGTRVYVNYNNEDYMYGNNLIPARDYKVERGIDHAE